MERSYRFAKTLYARGFYDLSRKLLAQTPAQLAQSTKPLEESSKPLKPAEISKKNFTPSETQIDGSPDSYTDPKTNIVWRLDAKTHLYYSQAPDLSQKSAP